MGWTAPPHHRNFRNSTSSGQMRFIHRHGTEAALPEVSGELHAPMDLARITAMNDRHAAAQCSARRSR